MSSLDSSTSESSVAKCNSVTGTISHWMSPESQIDFWGCAGILLAGAGCSGFGRMGFTSAGHTDSTCVVLVDGLAAIALPACSFCASVSLSSCKCRSV